MDTKIIMNITKTLKQYLSHNPTHDYKNFCELYPDINKDTVKRVYYRIRKGMSLTVPMDIRTELIKIITDYKQPASARVQAIREYNNLVEKEPDKSGEDPYLKFLEKKSLRIATTIDTSSNQ